jgi:serine/threonine protein kinase
MKPSVPGYRILRPLKSGGWADIFLARNRKTGQCVAIKVLKQELLVSPAAVERFRTEAAKLKHLDSPAAVNVVRFLDSNLTDPPNARPFTVLEYIAGGSVRDLLDDKRPVGLKKACDIVCGAARGAAWVHEITSGIHRDIKPDNILLDGDTPKLADLGIWRMIEPRIGDGGKSLTANGVLVGTLVYTAPELLRNPLPVECIGPWIDVYSLGVVLYELLTNRLPPFDPGCPYTPTPLPVLPPSKLREDVHIPPELDDICVKCLKPKWEDRPTVNKLVSELDRIASTLPFDTSPSSPLSRKAIRPLHSPKVWATAIGTAAVTITFPSGKPHPCNLAAGGGVFVFRVGILGSRRCVGAKPALARPTQGMTVFTPSNRWLPQPPPTLTQASPASGAAAIRRAARPGESATGPARHGGKRRRRCPGACTSP